MLFLTYFELNEAIPVQERLRVAQELPAKGLFPAPGTEIVRWDLTPDDWGIALVEAESAAAVERGLAVWRMALPGMFRKTRTAPVMPVADVIPVQLDVLKKLG